MSSSSLQPRGSSLELEPRAQLEARGTAGGLLGEEASSAEEAEAEAEGTNGAARRSRAAETIFIALVIC